MPIAHIVAAGMGGMRTAGDLVAWMQMARRMKIADAKRYVADKLGIGLIDLTDEDVMHSLRDDLGIGVVTGDPGKRSGITAKLKIAELLDIEINSVNYFKSLL
jgi:dimethylamine--corrinoid protein Co-methyltransferase